MKLKNQAFTLSEVLITLGIIGVVAAITIPGLIAKTTQAQYDARFKKVFSTLQQAGRMAQAQYDWTYIDINTPCGNNPATEKPTETMSLCALFNGTLKGATYLGKLSDLKDKNGNCYYNDNTIPGRLELLGQIFIPAANAMRINRAGDYIAYSLSDGAIVAFDTKIDSTRSESRIFVDVNGLSLPNSRRTTVLQQVEQPPTLLGQIFIPSAYAA